MYQVTLQEAKSRIADLFESVLHGEEIVVTDREKPVLKMSPVVGGMKERRGLLGSAEGLIEIADDFDETPEEFEEYI